ncbi:unnamed protein product [Peniophora sp. CBMAI 1063]|nr:unnamed protein product [Peniophora sp. CBMAI 1063]
MSRVLAELKRSETPVKAEHSPSPKPEPGLDVKPDLRGRKRLSDMTLDDLDDRDTKRPARADSSPEPEESGNLPPELLSHIRSTSSSIQPAAGEPTNMEAAVQSGIALLRAGDIRRGLGGGGFRVNYDREGPLTQMDYGGPDQEKRLAEFVSKTLDHFASQMTIAQGMQYLGLKTQRDLLPGLEVRLLPHQIIGVAWMLMQERNDHDRVFEIKSGAHRPKWMGGILADEMGLGKTVQMIATMAMNMPGIDEEIKTTLIIVPAALLHQWKEELESKANGLFDVHIHHGKDKLKSVEAMKSKDVILTTYQTINLEYTVPPDVEDEERLAYLQQGNAVLPKMKWYRVILDEAHFVRNRSTNASKTVALVRSKYRWMLTGTPIINSLADIYGLLRFGKFRPWNDWMSFNDHVARVQNDDAPLAGARAQEIIKPILLRRSKNAMLEGEPLLKLPQKHINIVTEEFSAEEREIYDHLEGRAKMQINRFIRAGTLVKNSAFVLVLILRLRQLCCHPNLILDQAGDGEDGTEMMSTDADKEVSRATKEMGKRWVEEVKRNFLGRARSKQLDWTDGSSDADMYCPQCSDPFIGTNGRILACKHEICLDCLLNLQNSNIEHNGVFGQGDEKQNAQVEKKFEEAYAKGLRPCPFPKCGAMNDLRPHRVFLSNAFEPSEDEIEDFAADERAKKSAARSRGRATGPPVKAAPAPVKREQKKVTLETLELSDLSESDDDDMPDISSIVQASAKKEKLTPTKKEKGKVKDEFGFDDMEDEDEDELDSDEDVFAKGRKGKAPARGRKSNAKDGQGPSRDMLDTWRRGDYDLEPSTKMLAMIRLLKEAEHAGDKTIVYSQWTTMLDLVEHLFNRYGIRSLRYDGSMTRENRERAIIEFRHAGSPKVILISTKSGGVGLNLVTANRVVNLDLSWNYAAESQAYDRVHRLGQDKEVFISRLVVANTIEERMLRLQDVKTGLADAALGEGSGLKLNKLSVKEIKHLFGITRLPDPPTADPNQTTMNRQAQLQPR